MGEEEPDLTAISEEELRERLKELSEEERILSYRRRVVQGRIDLISAELVLRGGVPSPEDLVHVLVSGEGDRLDQFEGPGRGGV